MEHFKVAKELKQQRVEYRFTARPCKSVIAFIQVCCYFQIMDQQQLMMKAAAFVNQLMQSEYREKEFQPTVQQMQLL